MCFTTALYTSEKYRSAFLHPIIIIIIIIIIIRTGILNVTPVELKTSERADPLRMPKAAFGDTSGNLQSMDHGLQARRMTSLNNQVGRESLKYCKVQIF